MLDKEQLSVGALFRRFNSLPTFTLHAAGLVPGGFWRQYQLKAGGMTCEINETFDAGVFGDEDDDDMPGAPSAEGAYGI